MDLKPKSSVGTSPNDRNASAETSEVGSFGLFFRFFPNPFRNKCLGYIQIQGKIGDPPLS